MCALRGGLCSPQGLLTRYPVRHHQRVWQWQMKGMQLVVSDAAAWQAAETPRCGLNPFC